ncbi:hypothetical protein H4S02_001510 [Coemansia sp. RSA 2611]|nr:hypothetical protein H4S02_001510 [Coemansia sp. RSA 2611]
MSGSAERGHKDADSAEHDNDAERLDQSHDYADQARRRHERAQHVVRRHEDEGSIERGLAESEVRSIPVEEPPETIEEEYEEGYEEESPSAPPLRPPPALLFMGPVVISLVLFSMAGVLIRVHLTRLFTYLGEPIYGLIWAQMLGCFIMGIATRTKGVLLRYSPALNLGITTGLCGSITTFSSWQLLVYEQFFNTERHDHSHFRNFLGGMSVLASTLGCSMAALRLGQIIGDELRLLYGIYLLHTKSEDDPMYRVSTALLGPGKPTSPRRGWMGWDEWRTMDMILAVSGILAIVAACIVVALARGTRSVSIALLFDYGVC